LRPVHGWWWPGRQVFVVVPCLVLAVAWWAGRVPAVRPWVVAAGVVGAVNWMWLVVEVLRRRRTLIVDFEATSNPIYRATRAVLPDGRAPSLRDGVLLALWLVGLAVAAAVAAGFVRRGRRPWRASTRVP
jgi:hypothetical protein